LKRIIAVAALCACVSPAFAVGTLIPSSYQPRGVVHDDSRGLIYFTSGTQVKRYQPSTGSYLSPIDIAQGQQGVGGLDLSADNRYLAVSDDGYNPAGICVHLISLDTLAQQLECTPPVATMESGTRDAVYGADGTIYTTVSAFNMVEAPLRRLSPATHQWDVLTQVTPGSKLVPSGDAQTIGFNAYPYTGGPVWGFVDVPTGGVVRRPFTGGGRIGVDRFGAQFAVPAGDGTHVFDDAYVQTGVIPNADVYCLSYHPVERIAYSCSYNSNVVSAYNTNTLALVGSVAFDGSYVNDVQLSRDGSLLMALSSDGVRYYQQYAPLQASPISATANLNQAKVVTLSGSIGNGGALEYAIASQPAHGSVSLNGGVATYTPASGYVGADSFSYRVAYGRAARTANVSMTVVDPNRAPVAVNDSAATRNTAIQIAVLANDTDPDGDALSIASVTAPTAGTALIQGTKVLYTPPKSWPKTAVTFDYTISDGHGKTATARVTVNRN